MLQFLRLTNNMKIIPRVYIVLEFLITLILSDAHCGIKYVKGNAFFRRLYFLFPVPNFIKKLMYFKIIKMLWSVEWIEKYCYSTNRETLSIENFKFAEKKYTLYLTYCLKFSCWLKEVNAENNMNTNEYNSFSYYINSHCLMMKLFSIS